MSDKSTEITNILARANDLARKVRSEIQVTQTNERVKPRFEGELYISLCRHSQQMGDAYMQICRDVASERFTYISVAHGTRELLRQILEMLAPDEVVMVQPWFKQEAKEGASHKQRAKYILRQRRAGSNAEERTIEAIETIEERIEERIASLARTTYSGASAKAHTDSDFKEARRQLMYLDAILHDILDI